MHVTRRGENNLTVMSRVYDSEVVIVSVFGEPPIESRYGKVRISYAQ